jgi:hypothetical protein
MFHRDELGEHADKFLADLDLQVPEPEDDWRKMRFDHGPNDPEEPGISPQERQRRIDFLDQQWWPEVLSKIASAHQELPPGSFIKSWQRHVQMEPPKTTGYEVADPDEFA